MSTRIPTGHRIACRDHATLLDSLACFRARARDRARDRVARALAARIARKFDLVRLDPEEPGTRDGLAEAMHAAAQTEWDAPGTGRARPADLDVECEIAVLRDPQDPRHAYLTLHALHADDYLDILRGLDGVDPYPYWNDTDPPREITRHDWLARRDTWDRVLGHRPPAQAGPVLTLIGPHLPLPRDAAEIAGYLPSLRTRAARSAAEIVTRHHLRTRQAAGEIPDRGVAVMQATMEFLTSQTYARQRDALTSTLTRLLPAEIARADLERPATPTNAVPERLTRCLD